jgi:hypothetical protein
MPAPATLRAHAHGAIDSAHARASTRGARPASMRTCPALRRQRPDRPPGSHVPEPHGAVGPDRSHHRFQGVERQVVQRAAAGQLLAVVHRAAALGAAAEDPVREAEGAGGHRASQ